MMVECLACLLTDTMRRELKSPRGQIGFSIMFHDENDAININTIEKLRLQYYCLCNAPEDQLNTFSGYLICLMHYYKSFIIGSIFVERVTKGCHCVLTAQDN